MGRRRGASAVRSLIELGFNVDRDSRGEVAPGLEAAHSRPRIVHAGEDRSGAALHEFLRAQLAPLVASGRVCLSEHTSAVSLLSDSGAVTGAVLRGVLYMESIPAPDWTSWRAVMRGAPPKPEAKGRPMHRDNRSK